MWDADTSRHPSETENLVLERKGHARHQGRNPMSTLRLMPAACVGPTAAALVREHQPAPCYQHCCGWAETSSSVGPRVQAEGCITPLLHQLTLAGTRAFLARRHIWVAVAYSRAKSKHALAPGRALPAPTCHGYGAGPSLSSTRRHPECYHLPKQGLL